MAYSNFHTSFTEAARVNRFEVTGLVDGESMFAKGASIPGHTIGNVEVWHNGRAKNLPGDRTTEDWTVTFYGDKSLKHYETLLDMHDEMMSIDESNFQLNDKPATNKVNVQLIDRYGEPTGPKFELHGAYISSMPGVDLDMGTNDTPLEFTVTFKYDYLIY